MKAAPHTKTVMFTAKHMTPERLRFEKAIASATLPIKTILVEWCCWFGDDFTFSGSQADYEKLYFWICGYGDGITVMELELARYTGPVKPVETHATKTKS